MCDRGCGKVLEESKLVRGLFFLFFFFFFQACNRRGGKVTKAAGPGGEAAKRQRRLCPGLRVLSMGRGAAAGEGRVKSSFCA